MWLKTWRPAPEPLAGRRRWRNVVLCVVLFLVLPPWLYFMTWQVFGRPRKPDTVGYAQLHVLSKTKTLRIDLPPGWRTQYRGRDRHQPHEAYLVDEQGNVRCDVYAGSYDAVISQGTVESSAQQHLESWQKLDDPQVADVWLAGSEFRDSPTGKIWVARYRRRKPGGYGGKAWRTEPVETTAYHAKMGPRLLVIEFHMRAAETGELEPLSWELFQTARLETED